MCNRSSSSASLLRLRRLVDPDAWSESDCWLLKEENKGSDKPTARRRWRRVGGYFLFVGFGLLFLWYLEMESQKFFFFFFLFARTISFWATTFYVKKYEREEKAGSPPHLWASRVKMWKKWSNKLVFGRRVAEMVETAAVTLLRLQYSCLMSRTVFKERSPTQIKRNVDAVVRQYYIHVAKTQSFIQCFCLVTSENIVAHLK